MCVYGGGGGGVGYTIESYAEIRKEGNPAFYNKMDGP